MLFRLIEFVVLTFFLLASEQVFAHANHSFFEFQPASYNQSFFDDNETNIIEATFTKNTLCEQFSINDIKQAENESFFMLSALTEHKSVFFENHVLLSQPSQNKNQKKIALQQIEEECNCLNDCSCLECQCADCPMSVSCSAVSIVLPNSNITTVQPIHEYLVINTISYFISQPHTLLFRPPITS